MQNSSLFPAVVEKSLALLVPAIETKRLNYEGQFEPKHVLFVMTCLHLLPEDRKPFTLRTYLDQLIRLGSKVGADVLPLNHGNSYQPLERLLLDESSLQWGALSRYFEDKEAIRGAFEMIGADTTFNTRLSAIVSKLLRAASVILDPECKKVFSVGSKKTGKLSNISTQESVIPWNSQEGKREYRLEHQRTTTGDDIEFAHDLLALTSGGHGKSLPGKVATQRREEAPVQGFENRPRDEDRLPNDPRTSTGTIVVGIVESGRAQYVKEISESFVLRLATHPQTRSKPDCLRTLVEWGPAHQHRWNENVNAMLQRRNGKFNYLVAIGTQAALALKDALGDDFGQVPTLFLGVTYPRQCGLIDSESERKEKRNVTGIRFGTGLAAVAGLLHNQVFPGRKLHYVFRKDVAQDVQGFKDLAETRLAAEKKLEFIPLASPLQESDLWEIDAVYFSLYTFTRMFEQDECTILQDRIVVSTMPDPVRQGMAVAGVGTDHEHIGIEGANRLIKHLIAPDEAKPDWGRMDVGASPLRYWLNATVAEKRGVTFSERAIYEAEHDC